MNVLSHRIGRPWFTLFAVAAASLVTAADRPGPNRSEDPRMSIQEVQRVVADFFGRQTDHRPGDIITQSEVAGVLKELAAAGWQPANGQQIVGSTLSDGNPVVSTLRSERGRRFMRKVSGYDLIYDRMDRLSQVPGGPRTIDAIVRLPDGEKYALPKKQTPDGVPDFLDLLPKNASGKVRTVKDYTKPTGRIYTQADLVKRLSQSLESSSEPATAR